MVRQRAGSIIDIASLIGLKPGAFGHGVYSISKAGAIMLTRVLAKEWGRYGIRVNAIAPGFTETDMTKRIFGDPEVQSQYIEKYIQRTPLRRVTQPQDIVGAAVFLASRDSDFISGQYILVDGGIWPR